jgi:hypothetical protein
VELRVIEAIAKQAAVRSLILEAYLGVQLASLRKVSDEPAGVVILSNDFSQSEEI